MLEQRPQVPGSADHADKEGLPPPAEQDEA
jgi:multicomponent K+:H+ antiporter subunit G